MNKNAASQPTVNIDRNIAAIAGNRLRIQLSKVSSDASRMRRLVDDMRASAVDELTQDPDAANQIMAEADRIEQRAIVAETMLGMLENVCDKFTRAGA